MSDEMLKSVTEKFSGKIYAFVPTLDRGSLYRLSVVVDGETGHYPIIDVVSMERPAMQVLADRLNHELRIPEKVVWSLVGQSMRGDGTAKPLR